MRVTVPTLGLSLLALANGCERSSAGEEPAGEDAPVGEQLAVAEVYRARCASCHGDDGRGDGPAAGGLDPKPRDFTSAQWQAEVTDEQIERVIAYGGAALGKSAAMPSHPDLDANKLTLNALRAYIRDFGDD